MSDEPTADAITAAVLALPGVEVSVPLLWTRRPVCARTLSFSKSFETVYAIEVDESRHGGCSHHNCNLLSKSVAMGTVHTRHGDCLQVVPKIAKLHSTAAAGSSSSSALLPLLDRANGSAACWRCSSGP